MLIRFPEQRKWSLLLASYFFYGFWDWRFTILLFTCSGFNYIMALGISNAKYRKHKKVWLITAVIMDLGILFFFKYYGFFMNSVNNISLMLGLSEGLPILSVVLPVGISFFTFQAMSYVIDVYRGEIHARESLGDVLLYISFFPQLVAGPIVRASVFLPQLDTNPAEDQIPAGTAFVRIIAGLFKKTVIANYLAVLLVDPVFLDPASYSPLELVLGAYGYAFQIFCDFSAYSDIAIGIATLLGYKFPENFNQPYRATSFQDFWRRWHISLSSWLRDYLYIPLGGSKSGGFKTYRNLFITMLLGGLWHGAAWNFIIWGGLHGTALVIERKLGLVKKMNGFAGKLLKRVIVFQVVCVCWIFFRASDLRVAGEFFMGFTHNREFQGVITPFTVLLLLIGLIMHFTPSGIKGSLGRGTARLPALLQGTLFGGFLLILHILSPQGVAPFIYFQF
ncbi:MAG: MBOAT family protein [Spirochaetales bacterium]|nr:MBOAT family protein [Spirochaetales bacterium]